MMDGSERQSHGEDHVVRGRVEFSRRDLDARADSESDTAVQRNSSDDQSGCQEHLLLAGVLSVLKKRGIHFDFWPQPAKRLILKGVVPRMEPVGKLMSMNAVRMWLPRSSLPA